MKKMNALLILGGLTAAAAALTGCGNQSASSSDTLSAKDITDFPISQVTKIATRNYRLTNAEDTAYLRLSTLLNWPVNINGEPLDSLQKVMLKSAYNFVGTDPNEAIISFLSDGNLFEGDFTATPADSVPEFSTRLYEVNVSSMLNDITQKSVNCLVTTTTYMGGAHPNTSMVPFTYIYKEQSVLDYDNTFLPGYEEKLAEAVRESLAREVGVMPDKLAEAGFFGNDIPLAKKFYVADGYMVFHYNPYEIAPYSVGMIDVEVSPYVVRELLTPMAKSYFDIND